MKKIWFPVFYSLFLFSFLTCKEKKKAIPENERFFPVLPIIKSQVANVDTSLYSIRKITYVDSTKADTVYYRREQFRELASDFLNMPDISDIKYKDRFSEEKQFDGTLNRSIISYRPLNPEKEEIQLQQVLIRSDPSGDKITSIIIDYLINSRDSSVQKKLLWQMDKSFQVVISRQLPGQHETNSTYKVIWNEENDE
jgi:hypothetical protein